MRLRTHHAIHPVVEEHVAVKAIVVPDLLGGRVREPLPERVEQALGGVHVVDPQHLFCVDACVYLFGGNVFLFF